MSVFAKLRLMSSFLSILFPLSLSLSFFIFSSTTKGFILFSESSLLFNSSSILFEAIFDEEDLFMGILPNSSRSFDIIIFLKFFGDFFSFELFSLVVLFNNCSCCSKSKSKSNFKFFLEGCIGLSSGFIIFLNFSSLSLINSLLSLDIDFLILLFSSLIILLKLIPSFPSISFRQFESLSFLKSKILFVSVSKPSSNFFLNISSIVFVLLYSLFIFKFSFLLSFSSFWEFSISFDFFGLPNCFLNLFNFPCIAERLTPPSFIFASWLLSEFILLFSFDSFFSIFFKSLFSS